MLACKFEVVPAIDVLEGRVVRLSQGRRDAITLEGGEPLALARRYATEGAGRLHVVDLDGAFSGVPTLGLVERLATAGGLPIQVGGGYRTLDSIASALEAGADRVMIGTAALDPGFLDDAIDRFGSGIIVAIDVRNGRIARDGWTATTEIGASDLASRCVANGVERALVTSTTRDGSLAGPDLSLLEPIVSTGLAVIAAGGVSSLDDLVALREIGCEGAIAGSALLAGRFTLAEAIEAFRT